MLLSSAERLKAQQAPYTVAVAANQTDAYAATQRALNYLLPLGQFPNVTGRPVVIKPSLVLAEPSTTGTTTDPRAVQAVVDQCIAGGATDIYIVEGGQFSPTTGQPVAPGWAACGYTDIFTPTAYPQVQLLWIDPVPSNPGAPPIQLTPVPNYFVYSQIYLSTVLFTGDPVFISVAKLKTHVWAGVTLSCKNPFGLYEPSIYFAPHGLARGIVHSVSCNQSIVDMLLARPVDFAVIEGIVGMEGNGPLHGTPVNSGVVIAGQNPVAVDRYAATLMGLFNNPSLPGFHVSHLDYAFFKNLGPGPAQMSQIHNAGDSRSPLNFAAPQLTWPYLFWPQPSPGTISLSQRQFTSISVDMPQWQHAVDVKLTIIQNNEVTPVSPPTIKTLVNWTVMNPGSFSATWDGTDDAGEPVTPGTYLAQVTARKNPNDQRTGDWRSRGRADHGYRIRRRHATPAGAERQNLNLFIMCARQVGLPGLQIRPIRVR